MVLGAYYGKGKEARKEEHGLLTSFLMGVYDEESKQWKTVCKLGSGHDDASVQKLQKTLKNILVKIQQDFNQVPSWLSVHRSHVPDFVVKDPKLLLIFFFFF